MNKVPPPNPNIVLHFVDAKMKERFERENPGIFNGKFEFIHWKIGSPKRTNPLKSEYSVYNGIYIPNVVSPASYINRAIKQLQDENQKVC